MRALVTGGVGFVGTNLIKRLLRDGYEVISIDNYSTGYTENEQDGCHYIHAGVQDMKFWGRRLEKQDMTPDIIFHLAALARIQPSIKEPYPAIETNFNGTLNILEYARNNNIPVIYAGSSSFHHGLYGSPYAWSKYGGEELCKLYSRVYDLNTSICRFYNVYGDYMITEGDYATVVAIFQRQYENGESLTITGDGEQRRDFTHVDDIVDGLIKCVGKDFRGDIFELGKGENFSINEVADMFNWNKTYIPARPGEYDKTLCDYSRAKLELGWEPEKDLPTYVAKWLEENE